MAVTVTRAFQNTFLLQVVEKKGFKTYDMTMLATMVAAKYIDNDSVEIFWDRIRVFKSLDLVLSLTLV
jgi:hypothetical protein